MRTLAKPAADLPGSASTRPSPRPIRVCFLIDRLSRAGTETQLLALIDTLDRACVEPSLVLLDGEDDLSRSLEPATCPVLRLGVKSFTSRRAVSAARRFTEFLRSRRVDILQVYFLDSTYFGVPLARLAGVRRIVRVRNNLGYWLTRKHRLLGRIYRPLVDVTLTNSEQGRGALVAEGLRPERIAVLENGVDVERYCGLRPLDVARAQVRIGVLANLRPVKNLDLLIHAAAQVVKTNPNVQFEIAGEGEQRAQLENLIDELHLSRHVRLIGSVHDVPAFLGDLDIAVLCSRSEGMSNALLEYMASGRAIVATRVGAAKQLIRAGVDGLLIPVNDVAALVAALRGFLAGPIEAARLGASARERACASYSRDAMCRRFEEFYVQLCESEVGSKTSVRRSQAA